MRGEIGMRKSNPREPDHSHLGVNVLQDALRQKYQADGKTNQRHAGRTARWSEQELEERSHAPVNPFSFSGWFPQTLRRRAGYGEATK
jgi:hypothetical protein